MSSAAAAEPPAVQHGVPDWTFADRVRKVRRDVLGIEQAEFADRLGVTRQAYAAWESGRNEPRGLVAVAREIEQISGVPAAWILGVDAPFLSLAPQATSRVNASTKRRLTGRYIPDMQATVIPFPQLRARLSGAAASRRGEFGQPGELRAVS
jgi:transcriptional regulator with XRE-family HTH domain